MVMKASEKIIEGLTTVMEGFAALQQAIEEEYDVEEAELDDSPDSPANLEIDAAIVTEVRACVEAVMENEEYAPEEVASLVSTMTDALEEIDPGVFEEPESEEIEMETDLYEDDDDFDEDDDEYYEDEYDDFDD
jgi:hypothetical protein